VARSGIADGTWPLSNVYAPAGRRRALPAGALEIVSDDEAAEYVGGYIKSP
jgi:hypothetical protein